MAAPHFFPLAVSPRKHAEPGVSFRATRTAKAVCLALVQL